MLAEVRIPSERSFRQREQSHREGFDVDRKVVDALGRMAAGSYPG
jgi:LDH2 family malate/lactate/ureidoglycolate dehydrogenase